MGSLNKMKFILDPVRLDGHLFPGVTFVFKPSKNNLTLFYSWSSLIFKICLNAYYFPLAMHKSLILSDI